MQRLMSLLLDVWREACRHIEIEVCVARIAPVVAGSLPADLLVVRRLDLNRSCVETVATGLCKPGAEPVQVRSACSPEDIERLVGWCRRQEVLAGRVEEVESRFPGLLPAGLRGRVLVGPLNSETEPLGHVVFVAGEGVLFDERHEQTVQALCEPLAVALDNDRRLRELTKLRETLEADNRSLLSRLGRQDISESVVGAEAGLRSVMERVNLVARSDVPVLLLGETGTGKEVVARAIHKGSPRVDGPFLRVNCGAIPHELIDSELFGHERGSFTGAVAMRKGWFERADGGTLLLDEVGELPPAAQVRLLRVLQDGSFERVGGQQTRHVDVRVVAATNRDLRAMVAAGQFREDLWYRLAVFVIRIPPLRERVEDIPELAAHFALRAARRLGTVPLVPSPADNDLLVAYSWPGNVRELSAVMERAAILGNGRRLEVAAALGGGVPVPSAATTPLPAANSPAVPMPGGEAPAPAAEPSQTLDQAMVRHIEAALARTHGRIEGVFGAARLLGINPNTLRSRMRRLGIDWRRYRARASRSGGL